MIRFTLCVLYSSFFHPTKGKLTGRVVYDPQDRVTRGLDLETLDGSIGRNEEGR